MSAYTIYGVKIRGWELPRKLPNCLIEYFAVHRVEKSGIFSKIEKWLIGSSQGFLQTIVNLNEMRIWLTSRTHAVRPVLKKKNIFSS